jgi:hypothetical protein
VKKKIKASFFFLVCACMRACGWAHEHGHVGYACACS